MRTDELLLKWETSVRRLIADYRRSVQQRRSGPSGSMSHHHHTLSTGSSTGGNSRRYYQSDATSPRSTYPAQMEGNSYQDEFDDEEGSAAGGAWETDPGGLPRPRRDSEAANWNPSLAGAGRRSAPPGRDGSFADPGMRARSRTEDQNGVIMNDWRNQAQMQSQTGPYSRNMSISSVSGQSEASFGSSPPPPLPTGLPRGPRHQLSTSNLRRGQMTPEDGPGSPYPLPYSSQPIPARYANTSVPQRNNSQSYAPPAGLPTPAQYRSRSASSPMAYQPRINEEQPPLPNLSGGGFPGFNGPTATSSPSSSTEGIPGQLATYNSSKSSLTPSSTADDKRGSSESNSTSISEESQPYPTTPFGSAAGGRNGSGSLPISRQGSGDSQTVVPPMNTTPKGSFVGQGSSCLIRIHFEQELLKISIPGGSRIEDVAEKVLKKSEFALTRLSSFLVPSTEAQKLTVLSSLQSPEEESNSPTRSFR